jgi:glycosyltransferase involved in cell wall biosynthesis
MVNTDLTVLIPTYNRAKIVRRTIDLINKNLIYYGGETHILVGVDGDDETPELLRDVPNVKMLKGPRDGLGGNLNMLIDAAETTILFQMDDDHHLVSLACNERRGVWLDSPYVWLVYGP